MINRLDQTNMKPSEESDPINVSEPTKEGSEIASELVLAFAEALDKREDARPFEIMQSIVEFVVSTVRGIEATGKAPDEFRRVLMRNIELNFDYKDAKDQGIDLSELLLMGIKREFDDTET
tara:strand:- start:3390 stop:3752 length:363 start_codon:yes stop_codon:yes gene_type:complete